MKHILFVVAIFLSLASFGQSTGDIFAFTPFASSRYHASDSIQVQFQLATNNAKAATITVTQTAGPTVKWTGTPTWISGTTTNYTFWLQGLAPGTYSFTATGLSGSGTTGQQTLTFQVVADAVCPVCPPIPPPRTAVSAQVVINGQTFTIPLAGIKVTYSDGVTQ